MSIRINSVMQQQVATKISRADQAKRSNQNELASGVRIYSGAKDPAGLALSEKFRAKIDSLRESANNIGQARSAIQVASGATESIGGSLQRMRTLAVQAASGTLSAEDRAAIQQEFGQLQETVDSVATGTEFNGLELTDGSVGSFDVQVGDMQGDTISVGLGDLTATGLGVDGGAVSVASQAGAENAIGAIDQALDELSNQESAFGAVSNRLSSSFEGVQTEVENMVTTESRIRDADIAETTAVMARNQVLADVGLAVMAQANTSPRAATRLLS